MATRLFRLRCEEVGMCSSPIKMRSLVKPKIIVAFLNYFYIFIVCLLSLLVLNIINFIRNAAIETIYFCRDYYMNV